MVTETTGFSLEKATAAFKINYYKRSANMYNSENPLQGRITKKYDFTGKSRSDLTPLSYSGGVGSRLLPKANSGKYENATIKSHRVYATCEIEREAIKASSNDAGAFVKATGETVKKTVESHMRNASRILFGDGTGVLGKGNGAGTNVAGLGTEVSPYIIELPVANWKEANWEERDYVQMVINGAPEGGDTVANLLEVFEVYPETRKVALVGTSPRLAALTGANPLAATDKICMQRSYGDEPMGLKGVLDFTKAATGTLYNINYQRRWRMQYKDAAGQGITPDRINNMVLNVHKATGEVPDMIMSSYEQFQNILAFLEDQKVYNLPNKNLKGHVGFDGIEIMTPKGKVGLFYDRFVDADKVWFLNSKRIEVHHRPGFGWFDDDGTVFLRKSGEDVYEARYGGYYENFIIPTGHGCIEGLAI